ncbi:hypothetical protein P43SY_004961 [Pythium insidiosum]|uniref:ParB-like N-terminal domain-containing protein n=1 Tax=Pythium insidiosum TaxID=114742 RepID=A0AAD5LZH9_PYTIN|nr:hypothetical protein P43SY_004961 [Pythium insidiosum]
MTAPSTSERPQNEKASSVKRLSPSAEPQEDEHDCEEHRVVETAVSVAGVTPTQRRRKRDVVRQISMRLYLKGKDMAEDVLRNVVPQRVEDTEGVCGSHNSILEHEIAPSRKTRKHLWMPKTQDDSVLIRGTPVEALRQIDRADVDAFFLSRVTDPTSYFYRFHFDDYRHLTPQKAEVQLVDIEWLKPHEQVVSWERVNGLKKATISWDAYTEPLLVDIKSGAILDGHHRYNVGLQLRLKQLPAVLVDYLGDDTITVDVWPGCGRTQLTKEEVVEMSLSPNVFPPKTSRHRFTESLPPISIPLSVLRQNPTPINDLTLSLPAKKSKTREEDDDALELPSPTHIERQSSLRKVSISLICGAQNLATSVTKGLFRSRLRKFETFKAETQLDLIKRPAALPSSSTDTFTAIRVNDPTSSFCRQKGATLEDLLSSDASRREKFYLTRVCDPTSYFYKYHFDAAPKRQPKKVAVHLASIQWLKAHEHVVSWDRVDGLRRATLRWDAYLEPLLVDIKTGAILDGHHRYHVGVQLGLACVPCVMVDYLGDETITVDVWPNCGRDSLTKQEVIDMALSDSVFPPKTSRHTFSDDLPPISVPLARLRIAVDNHYTEL